jgi:hypothetical protein
MHVCQQIRQVWRSETLFMFPTLETLGCAVVIEITNLYIYYSDSRNKS